MIIWNIVITLLLVLLNGFFVAAEFAFVKLRNSQIELSIRKGRLLADVAKNIKNHLDAYLSATQLGITLASLGLGWIGEGVVGGLILSLFNYLHIPISPELAHKVALPVAFITITFLHIVFGELTPKSIAIQGTERTALLTAIPLQIFYYTFSPFIWILKISSNYLLKLMGLETAGEYQDLHSPSELRYIIEESAESGLIETSEQELIENVFDFTGTSVKQIMVPRNKIVGIEYSMSYESLTTKFIEDGYSRMPVFQKTIDNIIGVIYAKDMLSMMNNKDLIIPQDLIRRGCFVSEDMKINTLMNKLKKEHTHLAVVLDEFGGTAGIVTMEDVLEELVGEIQDEYDEELPFVEKINDYEFIVRAETSISDANEHLPESLPISEDYETVGGLITSVIGRIPEINEEIELDNYLCKIIKGSNQSIDLVKLTVRI